MDNVVPKGFIVQHELAPKLRFPLDIAASEIGSECYAWWKKVLIVVFMPTLKKTLRVPAFARIIVLF